MLYQFVEQFRFYLKKKGFAPSSVRLACAHVRDFALYLERIGVFDMRSVTLIYINDYHRELCSRNSSYGRPFTKYTILSKLCALRSFFRFMVKDNLMLMNPALYIDLPRWDTTPRDILTLFEMDALLSQPDPKTFRGLRDRVMLELFYSTGIRHQELMDLNIQDLDLVREILFIRQGKGAKDRVVPLGIQASSSLKRYLEVRKKMAKKESALFISPDNGHRIYYLTINVLLREYARRAGIQKKVTCHLLRHTCAVHFLEGGADVRSVQELLGHRSLETTQKYLTVSKDDLKKVHQKSHPRGKRQKKEKH